MKTTKWILGLISLFALITLSACEQKGPAEKLGEKIDNATEQAGDNIEDATDKMGDKMEKAGDKVEDATD